MSFYRSILEDSDVAVLDNNNSPEIEAIEDIVADSDANEFEQDEAKAAEFGTGYGEGEVEDIVDEMCIAIAESDMNFNKITQAIGIYELNETASGRTVIYESWEDIKSFFKKIKDWVVNFFKKVWQVINRYAHNVAAAFHTNKGFWKKYGSQVSSGYSKYEDGRYKLKMYPYTNLQKFIDKGFWTDESKNPAYSEIKKKIDVVKTWKETGTGSVITTDQVDDILKNYRSALCGESCEADELRDKMNTYIRGAEDKESGKMDPKDIKAALESNTVLKTTKKAMDEAKKSYKKVIGQLNDLEKSVSRKLEKKDIDDNGRKAINEELGNLYRLSDLFKGMLNATQVARAVVLGNIRGWIAQARVYGMAYVAADNKSKSKYKGFQSESAGYGFLSNIDLV